MTSQRLVMEKCSRVQMCHSSGGVAARCSYLSMDRADLQFSANEVCREMVRPVRGSLRRLCRLARYLITRPRLIANYTYQDWPSKLAVDVDATWAACTQTMKSTSGGVARWGRHVIKPWGNTLSLIAPSSGESELCGCIRGCCEAMGIHSMYMNSRVLTDILVLLDANAAREVIERKGLRKARHLDTDHLWLQQRQARRILPLQNVLGTANIADLMTKHMPEQEIIEYVGMMEMDFSQGRAAGAAQLHLLKPGRVSGNSWDNPGHNGRWRRHRSTWRRSLCTPLEVQHGPVDGKLLGPRRITKGVRRDGSRFTMVDPWKGPSRAHRILPFEWRGCSLFFVLNIRMPVLLMKSGELVVNTMEVSCLQLPRVLSRLLARTGCNIDLTPNHH